MIVLYMSVMLKWFKSGERYEAEAMDLRLRIEQRQVDAAANEIVGREVVRGLKKAQVSKVLPSISDAKIEEAYAVIEEMSVLGLLRACLVTDVKKQAKDSTYYTACMPAMPCTWRLPSIWSAPYFVADDHHLLSAASCSSQLG